MTELPIFAGHDEALTAGFGHAIHVGGVSAAIHWGLTTNMPCHLHVFASDFETAMRFNALAEAEDVVTNIRVKYRDERWVEDGIMDFQCRGLAIRASSPARAAAEAIAEDQLFDSDAKIDMLRSYLSRGHSLTELRYFADMMSCGGQLKQLLSMV
jgi:hypothetical protein